MTIALPTVDQVAAIVGELGDPLIQSAIDDAALIVERCVSCLDEGRQTAIVKWTACDLLTATETGSSLSGAVTSEKLGDAAVSYARGAQGTTAYWQRALALDPNGCLATIGKAKPIMRVL